MANEIKLNSINKRKGWQKSTFSFYKNFNKFIKKYKKVVDIYDLWVYNKGTNLREYPEGVKVMERLVVSVGNLRKIKSDFEKMQSYGYECEITPVRNSADWNLIATVDEKLWYVANAIEDYKR